MSEIYASIFTSDRIVADKVYFFSLKHSGNVHNVLVKNIGDNHIDGWVSIERFMYMYDKKGHPKCEFGFCENMNELEYKKDLNIVEVTKTFIVMPKSVIIPFDNIGLVEESPFPYLESRNKTGTEVIVNDDVVLAKFPVFKPYHSEIGGFYQNPVIVKKGVQSQTIPVKFAKLENKEKDGEKEGDE
jgi:hypothetical protein